MQEIYTPIHYFGQREGIVKDLFSLLPKKVYRNIFDPFSGSGSISFAAMKKGIGEVFFLNDSFSLLAILWEGIQKQPQDVISSYQALCNDLAEVKDQANYYKEVQNKFNQAENSINKAIYFVFLTTFAKNHVPQFDDKLNLACEFDYNFDKSLLNEKAFAFRVLYLAEEFQKHQVQFTSKHFTELLNLATSEDLVILDPPYPAQSSAIYHHLKKQEELQAELSESMITMDNKKIPFLLLYGAGPLEEIHQFSEKNVGVHHLVRLSTHPMFGKFLEHIYVSKHIPLSNLPANIKRYDELFVNNDYQKAFQKMEELINSQPVDDVFATHAEPMRLTS